MEMKIKSKMKYDYIPIATATAKSLQSCPTLCDPKDGSPPRSPVPGILQARTLEWVAVSFSNAWKWKGAIAFSAKRVQVIANEYSRKFLLNKKNE